MKKKLLSFLLLIGFALSSSLAMAANLSHDMKTLNGTLRAIEKSNDPKQLKKALHTMRSAAKNAQKKIPRKLRHHPDLSPEIQNYRHAYDILIQQIDHALVLVEQDQIDDAKNIMNDIKITRNIYHKKYR
ncbi:soluble cytochrome b562 [Providencia alcalifaciens]|uniref:Soluble cytochrome b562 n=1 Tax=Providencia alcalifaciens TaxID=126385 RepID=A0A4R3NEG7_9GAMM|nr:MULTISPECIES: cytochrome b562 [Providencia]MBC5792248.1 cytochrome b562 [Providencia sp. JUb39]TCT28135.1 soluble cytochrome b562 [Providencia alcalifaciens]